MIPRTIPTWQGQSWQEQLINAVRDLDQLRELLDLDNQDLDCQPVSQVRGAQRAFPLRVPHSYVQRMEKGNPQDPLLLQVLPQGREMLEVAGYSLDPLAEEEANRAPGIIQKYHGRVLLMVSSACAIHCRYCFRRHFPYEEHRQSRAQWQTALDSIAADPGIKEIIYSGGDPLSAPDHYLAWLTEQVAAIPHVTTLRIHTRLPVVLPDRIDPACLDWLDQSRLRVVMVIHSNHPREIDDEVAGALSRLREIDVTLLNQAVLLKGVNDNLGALAGLSEALFASGALPYYLHLPDKVQGTHHFDVDEARALKLYRQLQAQLPGYLVPKLAREIPGEPNKTLV